MHEESDPVRPGRGGDFVLSPAPRTNLAGRVPVVRDAATASRGGGPFLGECRGEYRAAIPCELVPSLGWKARIGLIVLASDHTVEFEWRTLMQAAAEAEGGAESIAVHAARIANDPEITTRSLAAMEARITATADLLLPGAAFDVIAYGCTSAAMLIGPDRVRDLVRAARPGVAVTEPVSAALAAFGSLGVTRVAMLTPYMPEVDECLRTGFEAHGLAIPRMGSFSIPNDNDASRISPDSLFDAGMALAGDPAVEGLFVSCTSIRLAPVIGRLEAALGKPVTSSNMALGWHALRLAGAEASLAGHGRLFEPR
ncbi:Asp/Glu racemase [Marivibrio halodurans]|uniref:maleate cis-trans isomerase family protein n=1 Tax=Marivibrio halodurans TaxID=2039722 RepID=UPI001B33EB31|nr:Asp/Glu racemase [Marivibrio halodurans]